MAIADQLKELSKIKMDIKQAINDKGIRLLTSAPFNEYAPAIQSIPQELNIVDTTGKLVNFSTEPVVVGKWTNDKPVYLQVIDGMYDMKDGRGVVIGTIDDVEEPIAAFGGHYSTSDDLFSSVPYSNAKIEVNVSTGNVICRLSNMASESVTLRAVVLVLFTKASDGPIVGELPSETPEPTPSVSNDVYSTEEVIVGTWIDGKPIYRTMLTRTITAKGQTTQLLLSDVDMLINEGGVIWQGKSNQRYSLDNLVFGGSTIFPLGVNANRVLYIVLDNVSSSSTTTVSVNAWVEYTKFSDPIPGEEDETA